MFFLQDNALLATFITIYLKMRFIMIEQQIIALYYINILRKHSNVN